MSKSLLSAAATTGALLAVASFVSSSGGARAQESAPATQTPAAAAPSNPLVGKPAPDFTLPDQNDKPQTLSGQRGKWVVLAFYPADKTRG